MRTSCWLLALIFVALLLAGPAQQDGGTRVYSEAGRKWYEDPASNVTISSDGRWALLASWSEPPRLVSLENGRDDTGRLREGMDEGGGAAFCGGNALARLGARGSEKGWFLTDGAGKKLSSVPADAELVCSSTGMHIAAYRAKQSGTEVFVGTRDAMASLVVDGRVGSAPFIGRCWVLTLDPTLARTQRVEKIPLPKELHSAAWAAWSPKGDEIAIEDHGEKEQRALWVVTPDGAKSQKLLEYRGTTHGGVDWTPDGTSIIFSVLESGRMQIFTIPRSGGKPKLISRDSATLILPQVSPDGRWVAASRIEFRKEIWRRPLPPSGR